MYKFHFLFLCFVLSLFVGCGQMEDPVQNQTVAGSNTLQAAGGGKNGTPGSIKVDQDNVCDDKNRESNVISGDTAYIWLITDNFLGSGCYVLGFFNNPQAKNGEAYEGVLDFTQCTGKYQRYYVTSFSTAQLPVGDTVTAVLFDNCNTGQNISGDTFKFAGP